MNNHPVSSADKPDAQTTDTFLEAANFRVEVRGHMVNGQ